VSRAQVSCLTLLLVTGSVLRATPFLLDRSLWLDEAKLALNVLERSPAKLFRPLDYDQVAAPVGFLLLEKQAVVAFGEGERALRLVPLLAGVASLWLFFLVARRWLSPAETLLAVALFALAQPLVYYASEVKQYSTDVFVALALIWAAGRALDARPHARWALVPAGVLGVWLSHPAVFVAAGTGLTLVLSAWLRGDRRRASLFAAIAAAWAASFLALYALVLSRAEPKGSFVRMWADGFPPVPPRSLADLLWPVRTFFGFFVDPAGLGLAGLAAVAFVLGCVRYGRSEPRVLALLVSPGLLTLLAALVHRYPFPTSGSLDSYPLPGRVVLFLVPAAMILVAAGVGWMARTADRDRRLLAGVMAAFLLVSLAVDAASRPAHRIRLHELRPLVATIARDGRPDDLLVLNTRAMPVFRYYVRRLEAGSSFVDRLEVVELPGTNRWDVYEGRLQALPGGSRVWVLYAHHPSWRSQQDEAFVLHVLARRGRLDREATAPGASLHLFSIGGPAGAPS
jgi:hypothetical protein